MKYHTEDGRMSVGKLVCSSALDRSITPREILTKLLNTEREIRQFCRAHCNTGSAQSDIISLTIDAFEFLHREHFNTRFPRRVIKRTLQHEVTNKRPADTSLTTGGAKVTRLSESDEHVVQSVSTFMPEYHTEPISDCLTTTAVKLEITDGTQDWVIIDILARKVSSSIPDLD